jgi:hypothetical protein
MADEPWNGSDMAKFDHYKYDGAFYRREHAAPGLGVREVLNGDKWVPCEDDDLMAPVVFGSRVDESEVAA